MSIRSVSCPHCGAAANIPAGMANVRCAACGKVWNVNQPVVAKPQPATAPTQSSDGNESRKNPSAAVGLIALVGGGMLVMVIFGMIAIAMMGPSEDEPTTAVSESPATSEPAPTVTPQDPETYRVVNLPEEERKRIYDNCRKTARTSIEKPLPLPAGGARDMMEDMLQKTYERELRRFAALHDVTYDDILEIIKEGDAKNWDPSPRSNATRGGQRVNPPEKSEGYTPNKNVR